jgi:hypothetical protein
LSQQRASGPPEPPPIYSPAPRPAAGRTR